MNHEVLLLIMKCIQGKIPEIRELKLWEIYGEPLPFVNNPEFGKAVKHMDDNPLFSGLYKPSNTNDWNIWTYVGPKNEGR